MDAKSIMDVKSITPELIKKWTCQRLAMLAHTLSDIDRFFYRSPNNSQHTIQPTESLGYLSVLPLETLTGVVLRLDVLSVTTLRRVNRRFITGAKHFDFATLYKALCEPHCVSCGNFGGYIYLITCLRVCYICFTENQQFLPMIGTYARMITGCSKKVLEQLPHIRSVEGRYADNGRLCRDRPTLWDREAVLSIQTTTPGSEKGDCERNNPRRFMAIVSAPYFELPSKVAKWGLYCLGCSNSHKSETYFRKQYTEQGFVDHIILYGPVVPEGRRPRHAPLDMPS
ncbi:hypothetical protein F4815DRAFT_78467 [Daldinia loculata]|nr:hypothetical protein F4815DRAFT_78467 [Daldinia loculata]